MKNQKDSGNGSLRKALADAEDGDRVQVPKGDYLLKSGPLVIDTDIEITGAGSSKTVIDARKDSGVIEVTVDAAPVEISKLAITKGKTTQGAGLLNLGALTLDRVLITKNLATITGAGIETGGASRARRPSRCRRRGGRARRLRASRRP